MRIIVIMTLAASLFLAGCSLFVASPVVGSGVLGVEDRPVANFDNISLQGDGELILTQDGTESLKVEADDNILPLLETVVRGNTLIIKLRDNTTIEPKTPIRYYLSIDNLQQLSVVGDGKVKAGELSGEALQFELSGDGELASGAVTASRSFAANVQGDGSIEASSISSPEATIDISGDGAIFYGTIQSETTLTIDIRGDGVFSTSSAAAAEFVTNILGDGHVTIEMLTAETVEATIMGDGRLEVAGEVNSQQIEVNGDGAMVAPELRSNHVDVTSRGDGHVEVWVIDTMSVNLTGDGHVSYSGSPQIEQSILGDGRLLNVDES